MAGRLADAADGPTIFPGEGRRIEDRMYLAESASISACNSYRFYAKRKCLVGGRCDSISPCALESLCRISCNKWCISCGRFSRPQRHDFSIVPEPETTYTTLTRYELSRNVSSLFHAPKGGHFELCGRFRENFGRCVSRFLLLSNYRTGCLCLLDRSRNDMRMVFFLKV